MANSTKIKKGLKLGELDAEADQEMLDACFVDNGQLESLCDVNSAKSIILGRTGSGKSAFLYKLSASAEKSTHLDPNDISIRFLEHSNIIQFFNELGVKLDLFYRILWRHILTVELLKLRYNLRSETQCKTFWSRFNRWTQKDSIKTRALEYFSEWGNKFWLETDEQLKELTTRFTENVQSQLGTKYSGVDISLNGAKGLDEATRTEVKSLATQVVSGIQIQKLNEVLELISDNAFDDRQKRYYILIDQLDEDWAETTTRCRFIRALIEETKALRRIPQVKVVTALRRDLLDLVFNKTRDSGFQEEKYEAYLEPIAWSKSDLRLLLNQRVCEVYRKQYTSDNVKFSDVFPPPIKGQSGSAIDYIVDRTLLRPRDTLQFANECFFQASDKPRITWRAMYAAEANYSQKRLRSLNEEWFEFYPDLKKSIEVLRGLPNPFTRSSISQNQLLEIATTLHESKSEDPCVISAKKLFAEDGGVNEADLVTELLLCLYHVGAIGIKISSLNTYIWSHIDHPRISKSEAKRANQIVVHKMLRHSLEIKDKKNITKRSRRTR